MTYVIVTLYTPNNMLCPPLKKRYKAMQHNLHPNLLPPTTHIQTHTSNQQKLNNIITNIFHKHQHTLTSHTHTTTPKPHNNEHSIPLTFNNKLLTPNLSNKLPLSTTAATNLISTILQDTTILQSNFDNSNLQQHNFNPSFSQYPTTSTHKDYYILSVNSTYPNTNT